MTESMNDGQKKLTVVVYGGFFGLFFGALLSFFYIIYCDVVDTLAVQGKFQMLTNSVSINEEILAQSSSDDWPWDLFNQTPAKTGKGD
jgi:hypothetical protein